MPLLIIIRFVDIIVERLPIIGLVLHWTASRPLGTRINWTRKPGQTKLWNIVFRYRQSNQSHSFHDWSCLPFQYQSKIDRSHQWFRCEHANYGRKLDFRVSFYYQSLNIQFNVCFAESTRACVKDEFIYKIWCSEEKYPFSITSTRRLCLLSVFSKMIYGLKIWTIKWTTSFRSEWDI